MPLLVSYDWPAPRLFIRPPEHFSVQGINLFTKTLDGYTVSLGVAELAYDESYAPQINDAANFRLRALTFYGERTVLYPKIKGSSGAYSLITGVREYPLTLIPAPIPGASKTAYAPVDHGGFMLVFDQAAGSPSPVKLYDTASNTVYTLEDSPISGFDYRPTEADLGAGFKVEYSYTGTQLTSAVLLRNAGEVEQLTVTYVGSNIQYILSSVDPARNVELSYSTEGPLESIGRGVLPPEHPEPVTGYIFSYTLTGGKGAEPAKFVLSGISNFAGNELLNYTLDAISTDQGMRTVYSGVRRGPPSVNGVTVLPLTVTYLQSGEVQIIDPAQPGNPAFITLHPTRGIAVKKREARCAEPIEELVFVPAGQPHAGRVQEERTRLTCDKLLLKRFAYEDNGTLAAIDVIADGKIATTRFTSDTVFKDNGAPATAVSSVIDPMQDVITLERDHTGRLKASVSEGGALRTTFESEYYDAAQQQVKKVTTIYPNGREDSVLYDELGRVAESARAVYTENEVRTQVNYDPLSGRLMSTQDPRGNVNAISYVGARDDRVTATHLTPASGEEQLRSETIYRSDIPELPAQTVRRVIDGGNVLEINTVFDYLPGTELISKISQNAPGASPATVVEFQYDPSTFKPTRQCGYSKDGSPQACSEYFYKSSESGSLAGVLDKVQTGGGQGTAVSGFDLVPHYNASGEVDGSSVVAAIGSTTSRIEYDGFGRLAKITENPDNPQYKFKRAFSYDLAGKVSGLTEHLGAALLSSITYIYDNFGKSSRISQATDTVSGISTTFSYEPATKRFSSSETVGPEGILLASQAINSYDRYDRPTLAGSTVDGVGSFSSEVAYNAYGDLVFAKDSRGSESTFDYDSLGRMFYALTPLSETFTEYHVDTQGKRRIVASSLNRTADAGLIFPEITSVAINAAGESESIEHWPSAESTAFRYDNQGRLERSTTSYGGQGVPAEDVREYGYDAAGRLSSERLNGSQLRQAEFTGLGRMRKLYDARGNTTLYEHDPLGNISRIAFPDGGVHEVLSRQYYPQGAQGPRLITEERNRGGDTITTEYNRFDLPVLRTTRSVQNPGIPETESWDYDDSRLVRKNWRLDLKSSEVAFSNFDQHGRATLETKNFSSPYTTFSLALGRGFDEQGLLTSHNYAGTSVIYDRDPLGRIFHIAANNQFFADYTFDGPFLRRSELSLIPNTVGVGRSYSYGEGTGLGLLSGVSDERIGFVETDRRLHQTTLTYDERRRLKYRGRWAPDFFWQGEYNSVETFDYNAANMLSQYRITAAPPEFDWVENYDPRPDGILLGIEDNYAGQCFALTEAFNYDSEGQPRFGGARDFYWKDGNAFSHLVDNSKNLLFSAEQDSFKRMLFGRHYFSIPGAEYTENSFYLRDGGMMLWRGKQTSY